MPEEQIDKAAFTLCALMHLHQALRRRDVFAEGSERWSDPRARLLDGEAWQAAMPQILTSLELEAEPAGHLAELAGALEGAYTRVLDGLGANTAVQFVGGRLQLEKLGRRPVSASALPRGLPRTGIPDRHRGGAGSAPRG
ncbi:hypothetical protein ACWENQ_36540 [Nonomuraea sp. NPDC004354]